MHPQCFCHRYYCTICSNGFYSVYDRMDSQIKSTNGSYFVYHRFCFPNDVHGFAYTNGFYSVVTISVFQVMITV